MSNAFALLGLPRIAALGDEALQQAWLAASRSAHPDQPGGDAARAAEINSAYETLQAPEKRLKHLLDLHQVPWRTVPIDDAMMALFGQMGPALQSAATFLKRKQTATSALAKALLAPDEMRLREQLEALGTTLDAERTSLLGRLPTFDTRLSTGDTTALADLQILQARLAYFSKWQAQIREAFLSLM
jgi:hypothetical protein